MDTKQTITAGIGAAAVLLCAAAFLMIEVRSSEPNPPVDKPAPKPPQHQDWGIRDDWPSRDGTRRCVDSDEGAPHQGVFVPGTTEEDGVFGQDHCSGPDTLVEYFCYHHPRGPAQRRWYGLRYNCPRGCAGGACRGSSSGAQPSVSQLNGSRGSWRGCRGTGAHVCAELVPETYRSYWRNHPECIINFDCGGQHFTCNSACPAPGELDR